MSLLRLNVWSGPRNLSTALMYSWRQRPDTTVVDEPLYGHYLSVTGRPHPLAAEVMASQCCDGARVIDEVILGPYDTPVVFFKQMAKHLVEVDREFLASCANVLLTRSPLDMLISFQRAAGAVAVDDTGLVELVEILDWLIASGQDPIVIDTVHLLADPPGVLTKLCDRLGLEFDEAMLSWPTGPTPEDGVWASHWYGGVHASTGWQPPRDEPPSVPPGLEGVLAEVDPLYRRLAEYGLR